MTLRLTAAFSSCAALFLALACGGDGPDPAVSPGATAGAVNAAGLGGGGSAGTPSVGGNAMGGSAVGGANGGNAVGGGAAGGGAAGAANGGSALGGSAAGGAVGGQAGLAGSAGSSAGSGGTGGPGALHVKGNQLADGNGEKVVMRGPELVLRWGEYAGVTSLGVDVPWEGGRNHDAGPDTIREIAKTKANALRIYGGFSEEVDAVLNTAILEQKMFVIVGRMDWTNAQLKAVLQKYAKYIAIHPRGEFTHRDANLWRTEALKVVKELRELGYTSPIEVGTTGYGQTWSTISQHGREVAESDPLKNTFFLMQLYSELAGQIPQTLASIKAFPHPVNVGSCLFTSTYGNTPNTYKEVWDQTLSEGLGSFYWDWWGDGEGNSMTTDGKFGNYTSIGQYIVNDSPAALKNTVKTQFLLNAALP